VKSLPLSNGLHGQAKKFSPKSSILPPLFVFRPASSFFFSGPPLFLLHKSFLPHLFQYGLAGRDRGSHCYHALAYWVIGPLSPLSLKSLLPPPLTSFYLPPASWRGFFLFHPLTQMSRETSLFIVSPASQSCQT